MLGMPNETVLVKDTYRHYLSVATDRNMLTLKSRSSMREGQTNKLEELHRSLVKNYLKQHDLF